MAAASIEAVKKGWLLAVISMSSSIITYVAAVNRDDDKELNAKIESKADKDYVDQRFEEYEKIQKAHYQGIYDMFSITNEQLKEIRADIREIKK